MYCLYLPLFFSSLLFSRPDCSHTRMCPLRVLSPVDLIFRPCSYLTNLISQVVVCSINGIWGLMQHACPDLSCEERRQQPRRPYVSHFSWGKSSKTQILRNGLWKNFDKTAKLSFTFYRTVTIYPKWILQILQKIWKLNFF